MALSFYANGSFLKVAGDFCGVSKSTACKTVRRVSRALLVLRPNYIRMPENNEEISESRQRFYSIAAFPRCIGAIDCTHIKIQSPGGGNAEIFRNRKQFFSLNVQTIASTDLKIQDIVTRWPGSAHDSYIFRNSNIFRSFEGGHFGDSVIIGDSGYPVKPYLITPLLNTRNEAEALFNESIIRTRNVVERQYGVWKRRFPALAMGLRLNLDTTQAVIVSTAVLHNVACNEREDVPLVNAEQEAAINLANNVNVEGIREERGGVNNITRYNFINNYFARL